jgi:hypothetical protein
LGSDCGNGDGVLHLKYGLMQGRECSEPLVLGALCVEEGDEHLSVALAFGVVCG